MSESGPLGSRGRSSGRRLFWSGFHLGEVTELYPGRTDGSPSSLSETILVLRKVTEGGRGPWGSGEDSGGFTSIVATWCDRTKGVKEWTQAVVEVGELSIPLTFSPFTLCEEPVSQVRRGR